MTMRLMLARLGALTVLASIASGAMAFADDDARRAILDLRAQVQALEEQLKNTQMTFVNRLDSLQNQNRILTGKVEELTNALNTEKRSNRQLYANIDERVGKFEPKEIEVNGEKFKVMPQEQAAYDAALELLKAGDYKAAVTRFTKFATDWENSPYRADALYWRGSCHFALEQYKSTINVQNQLIKQYPKHSRVPDAMISVASAQASLGNVKAAAATLKKVIKQFPDSEASKSANQLLKTLK